MNVHIFVYMRARLCVCKRECVFMCACVHACVRAGAHVGLLLKITRSKLHRSLSERNGYFHSNKPNI